MNTDSNSMDFFASDIGSDARCFVTTPVYQHSTGCPHLRSNAHYHDHEHEHDHDHEHEQGLKKSEAQPNKDQLSLQHVDAIIPEPQSGRDSTPKPFKK
jgi:hypothetical protein